MRVSRFFWFLISILFGAAAGLVIGWYLRPTPMSEVQATSLRSDYRTDYVLMVAEVYDAEKDLVWVRQSLQLLGDDPPVRLAQVAVVRAGELAYERRDLELLARLAQALLAPTSAAAPTPEAVLTPQGSKP